MLNRLQRIRLFKDFARTLGVFRPSQLHRADHLQVFGDLFYFIFCPKSGSHLRVFKSGVRARAPHTPASKLSLRLLPAIVVDNDEDDDGNFTNWMSSYWGHGGRDDRAKERKRSFQRSRPSTRDRRASLPCTSQLEAMRLKHPLTPRDLKVHEEVREVRSHPHARRVSSDEYRGDEAAVAESHISTVPELTESFRRMLRSRKHRVPSLNDLGNVCLICREEMCVRAGETRREDQELPCSHHFRKEVRRLDHAARPRSRSSAAVCENSKDASYCSEQEDLHLPRQHRRLRRQR